MWHRIPLLSVLLWLSTQAIAEETVIRGANALRDGNLYADAVHVDFGDEVSPSAVMDTLRNMPRLETLVIGGPRFMDWHLAELAKLKSLRVLVLDSADVSEKALAKLQSEKPDLVVIRSQRWAIQAIEGLASEIETTTRLSEQHPEIRQLLGDRYFQEAIAIDFGRLPDVESGPFDCILNEDVAPLRMIPTLTHLNLSCVRLNDGGMYYLQRMTRMERLAIPLAEVSATGLIHLRGMQNLKFFGGRIDDAGMQQLTGLQAIEDFRIDDDSEMTDAGLESIGQLRGLKNLLLLAPRIEGSGLRHLAELPHLQELVLGTGVRDISALPEFPALRRLVLAGTAVTDESLASLANCPKLEIISLDRTTVGDHGVMQLSGLTRLIDIELNDTQVGDAGLAVLEKLPDLRYLGLSRTRVSNAGLAALQRFPALTSLRLHGMPFNEEGIQKLMKLKQLKSLEVTYRRESFSELETERAANRELWERLEKALPGLRSQSNP